MNFTDFFKALIDFIMNLVSYFKNSDNTEIEDDKVVEE